MRVHVRWFAHLRERVGSDRSEVELEENATLAKLRDRLREQHPGVAGELDRYPVVVAGEVASLDRVLREGEEVAWLPPVAGGSGSKKGRPPALRGEIVLAEITDEPIEAGSLTDAVRHPAAGAVVVFWGVVRDHEGDRSVESLTYEAYEVVATDRLHALARECLGEWPEVRIAIRHRVGRLALGEASVIIAVASPHRAEAFACCSSLMDRIKVGVPIWKKSHGPGGDVWVEGESYREGTEER